MESVEQAIKTFAHDNLVSVTLEYHSGPGLHDFRCIHTNLSGAALQNYVPPEGTHIVGICSLDDEWE